ncbi:acyltransferase family protein [Sphingomonas sp. Leaf23]|uniref:acyltransferase family protein n=1 Tax=Sphingomonas sp. Leaf23 TaxID=1735689 RepID=UPI0012E298D1|nr:acyltransferase family protein [Sphingomonas sp. Leaf23]
MKVEPAFVSRIRGLDLWRSILLLMGVFLHASLAGHPSEWVGVVTRKFRMETFFLISGILSQISFSKRGRNLWLKERSLQLAVPAIFGVLVLNQLWLILHRINTGINPENVRFWYQPPVMHFWFLFVLLGCSILHGFYYERYAGNIFFNKVFNRPHIAYIMIFSFLGLLLQASGIGLAAKLEENLIIERLIRDFSATFLAMPYYSIFYFWGVEIAKSPVEHNIVSRINYKYIILLILAFVAIFIVSAKYPIFILNRETYESPFYSENIFEITTRAILAPILSILIVQFAYSMKKTNSFYKFLARAGYTLYVTHFVFIALAICVGQELYGKAGFSYSTIVLVTIFSCYAMHYFIVERFKTAKFLLNGSTKSVTQMTAFAIISKAHRKKF